MVIVVTDARTTLGAATLQTVEALGRWYPVKLVVTPAPPIDDERYLTGPEGCCGQRKVGPRAGMVREPVPV